MNRMSFLKKGKFLFAGWVQGGLYDHPRGWVKDMTDIARRADQCLQAFLSKSFHHHASQFYILLYSIQSTFTYIIISSIALSS